MSIFHLPRFIINMYFAFQDYENLYIVMDLLTGGDLRFHLSRVKKFNEEQTSKITNLEFFVACIITGLEYIHNNKILHRDIKPENLVLDQNGYVRITDFGVAKWYTKDNANETSGTPGYMAPEVLCSQNHSYVVDYYAIGVIIYEFMFGRRPYIGKSRKEIKDLILAKQVMIGQDDIPTGWSREAIDFVNKVSFDYFSY
jgi:serine/threonine protein kinase